MAKSSQYSAKEVATDDLEKLTERLTTELRTSIRQLGPFPVLSVNWIRMAQTFGRIASISDMESRLAPSKGPASGGSAATLWETEELALRQLIEEGKLNVSLRNLMDYKAYQRAQFEEAKAAGTSLAIPDDCNNFEKGVGVVLRNAWGHVEVMQTTDLPGLIRYAAEVLAFALANPEFVELTKIDINQRQEVMVYFYIWGIFKHIEEISERRIMSYIRAERLFSSAVKFLDRWHGLFSPHSVLIAAEALAMIADTEDFATYRTQYIENDADNQALQSLRTNCLSAYQSDFDARRKLRPLLDAADHAKRRFGTK